MTKPGLAEERTAIAWGRTGLSAAGLGVIVLRLGIARGSVTEMIAGIVALLLGAGLAARGRVAYRDPVNDNSVLAHRLVALSLVAIGVLAIVGALR
ncbi:MAG TPA: DUF202 domain-containing protein [Jatrophihabitantaceae bacterium]|jgi:uncharacterized membrane protein YidH (DUF202 family)